AEEHLRRGPGVGGSAVMFGNPESVVAEPVAVASQFEGFGKGELGAAPLLDGGLIENGYLHGRRGCSGVKKGVPDAHREASLIGKDNTPRSMYPRARSSRPAQVPTER